MLSKAPTNSRPPMEEESAPRQEDKLNKDEMMDQEIASAALFEGLLSEEGLSAIERALKSPEPAKALALLIYNVIEPAQVASMDTDTPISPRVWLANGGAVDELFDELYELAGALGVDDDMLEEMFPSIKQEVAGILAKRGADLQQQGMSASQPPSPAPVPTMGGA